MRLRSAVLIAGLATVAAQAPVAGQTFPPTYLYQLDPETHMEHGCFAPCECPVMISEAMAGTMQLVGTDVIIPGDPVRSFAVRDVRWKVSSGSQTVLLVGSGKYQVDEALDLHRMELDLGTTDAPPVSASQHFESGWVPHTGTLEHINIDLSIHGEFCRDSVVRLRSTLRTTDVPGDNSTLAASAMPNPFGAGTDIVFTLPQAGVVEVRVFDPAGRQVAVIANGWHAAGRVVARWDGRDAEGRTARAGLYVVRIAGAARHTTLRVARIP